eukprot:TCALIF_01786-PA protein Name:"Similar to br Broad-complex core protein isoforms 1/2/3/4/5 (Drosophila melanogaster)" AED:0.09 eAED:0.10 QI:0/-1/0/1/-1/1/1/0/324
MGTSENFRLKWNDYESSVSGAFQELRQEGDFFDVSLSCDESHGRTLQAHKVILSACSTVFKDMLKEQLTFSSPTAHLLIYLRGVRYSELSSILDFVYQGEVNVHQDSLDSFLAVAKDFQIKGLIQRGQNKDEGHTGPSRKRHRKSNYSSSEPVAPIIKAEGENLAAPVDVSDFLGTEDGDNSMRENVDQLDDTDGESSLDAFDSLRDPNLTEGETSTFFAIEGKQCIGAYFFRFSLDLDRDRVITTLPDGRGYCALCDSTFSILGNARKHFRKFHQGQSQTSLKPQVFKCHICRIKYGHLDQLRIHLKKAHDFIKKGMAPNIIE